MSSIKQEKNPHSIINPFARNLQTTTTKKFEFIDATTVLEAIERLGNRADLHKTLGGHIQGMYRQENLPREERKVSDQRGSNTNL